VVFGTVLGRRLARLLPKSSGKVRRITEAHGAGNLRQRPLRGTQERLGRVEAGVQDNLARRVPRRALTFSRQPLDGHLHVGRKIHEPNALSQMRLEIVERLTDKIAAKAGVHRVLFTTQRMSSRCRGAPA
jgi:hypothetical protein